MKLDLSCPNEAQHTLTGLQRYDYLGWHAWAKQMTKTHRQHRCPSCGRWEIWKLKRKQPTDEAK